MHDLKFLLLSLSLFFFVGTACADCIIHEKFLSSQNLYLTGSKRFLDIQRSDIVPVGQTLQLLCDTGIKKNRFVCQPNNNFNPSLDTASCSKAAKPSVFKMPDSSCPTSFLTYAVGFLVKDKFIELFRNCFDGYHLALQHSIYKAYRYRNSAPRPLTYFSLDRIMTGAEAAAYQGKKMQNCLLTNLGAHQPNCELDRGHMTPSAGFIFSELRKSTDKYLNVVPQYKLVNIGNWKNIEAWVNNLVKGDYDNHRTYDVLKVCTGALGVHELRHSNNNNMIPIYLLGNSKIPVPKWTYKIVSHLSGDKWVILTHNDVNPPSLQDLTQICNTTICHPGLNLNGVGYTACCDPYGFINTNLDHLTGLC